MRNKIKMLEIIALIAISVFLFTACISDVEKDVDPPRAPYLTGFNISGTGSLYFDGEPKIVTVTSKKDHTTGDITVFYMGTGGTEYEKSLEPPIFFGTYSILIDVSAAEGWADVYGLPVGTLSIIDGTPDIPTNINASVQSESSIRVNWSSVARAANYNVYYMTENDEELISAGNVSGTSYTHNNLTIDTVYWYYITAVNEYGESNYSSFKAVATRAPQTPATVIATATGSNTLTLRWASVTGASSYKVYYNTTGASGNKLSWASNSYTGTSCGVTGLAGNTTYYFFVTAVNALGESEYSAPGSAKTFSGGAFNAGLKATVYGGDGVSLSWNKISSARSYNVVYAIGSPDSQKYYAQSFWTVNSWVSPSGWIKPNTTYYFWISYIYSFSTESGLSEMVVLTTGSPSPISPTPSGLPSTPPTGGSTGERMCPMCQYSGLCSFSINGHSCINGYYTCYRCHGTGIFDSKICTVCIGAKKLKCGVCDGTGMCQGCDGVGKR